MSTKYDLVDENESGDEGNIEDTPVIDNGDDTDTDTGSDDSDDSDSEDTVLSVASVLTMLASKYHLKGSDMVGVRKLATKLRADPGSLRANNGLLAILASATPDTLKGDIEDDYNKINKLVRTAAKGKKDVQGQNMFELIAKSSGNHHYEIEISTGDIYDDNGKPVVKYDRSGEIEHINYINRKGISPRVSSWVISVPLGSNMIGVNAKYLPGIFRIKYDRDIVSVVERIPEITNVFSNFMDNVTLLKNNLESFLNTRDIHLTEKNVSPKLVGTLVRHLPTDASATKAISKYLKVNQKKILPDWNKFVVSVLKGTSDVDNERLLSLFTTMRKMRINDPDTTKMSFASFYNHEHRNNPHHSEVLTKQLVVLQLLDMVNLKGSDVKPLLQGREMKIRATAGKNSATAAHRVALSRDPEGNLVRDGVLFEPTKSVIGLGSNIVHIKMKEGVRGFDYCKVVGTTSNTLIGEFDFFAPLRMDDRFSGFDSSSGNKKPYPLDMSNGIVVADGHLTTFVDRLEIAIQLRHDNGDLDDAKSYLRSGALEKGKRTLLEKRFGRDFLKGHLFAEFALKEGVNAVFAKCVIHDMTDEDYDLVSAKTKNYVLMVLHGGRSHNFEVGFLYLNALAFGIRAQQKSAGWLKEQFQVMRNYFVAGNLIRATALMTMDHVRAFPNYEYDHRAGGFTTTNDLEVPNVTKLGKVPLISEHVAQNKQLPDPAQHSDAMEVSPYQEESEDEEDLLGDKSEVDIPKEQSLTKEVEKDPPKKEKEKEKEKERKDRRRK